MTPRGKTDKCSFCGREKRDVNLLIAGIEGHICDRCAEQAHSIIHEELKKEGAMDLHGIQVKTDPICPAGCRPKEDGDILFLEALQSPYKIVEWPLKRILKPSQLERPQRVLSSSRIEQMSIILILVLNKKGGKRGIALGPGDEQLFVVRP